MLSITARRVAVEADIKDFTALDKWAKGFKGRHRLSMGAPTRQGYLSPADIEKVGVEFVVEVERTARELGVTKTRIFNADRIDLTIISVFVVVFIFKFLF